MITGAVNANLEATLRLAVLDVRGQPNDVDAVIDTGFSGFLTLPPALILRLGLAWLCRQQGVLANGITHVFDVFEMTVIWHGQPLIVEVDAADAQPLVGMSLLFGSELRIKVVGNGGVTIDPLP